MSDIDKVFELLEKVYIELQDTKNEVKKIETTLEHDIKNKLQALNERAENNTVKLEEHSHRLDSIENKIDYLALSVNSQDKRLELVETDKKKKAK